MVSDTLLLGGAEVESGEELLHVVDRADGNAALADLAVDVGRIVGVFAVEGHAVKGRGKPLGVVVLAEIMKAPVRPLRRPLACELAFGVLFEPA